mgnify:CR=1 FL=1
MDKTVIGLFQSQSQVDILRDELENEGIPLDTLSVIGKRVKLQNATSNPQANSHFFKQVVSTGNLINGNYNSVEDVSNDLAQIGIEEDRTSTYANKIFEGNIGVILRVNEDQARIASGRFRNAGAKYVKIQ